MKAVAALPRYWPLLFPLTFLVHIAEEYRFGFYLWARVLGMRMDGPRFMQINAVAWAAMAPSVCWLRRRRAPGD